ncbi:MAG: ABC transporter substrate-binding protein [Clostridiales bacterium]|nr:ABC transporter substrate-binding protein [Clostridiales bacterium]
MTKRIISFILAVMLTLAVTVLSSCDDSEENKGSDVTLSSDDTTDSSTSNDDGTTTITLPNGDSATVPSSISSVITVSSAAETIFSRLSCSDYVKASYDVTDDCTSAIVSAAPDVVIYDTGANIDVDTITAAGIVAVEFPTEAESVTSIKNDYVKFVGTLMGVSYSTEQESIQKGLDQAKALVAAQTTWVSPSVYFELNYEDGTCYTVAPYSYIYELISIAGGSNIFGSSSDYEGFIEVTEEEVIEANPKIIFTVGSADDITGRDGWSEVDAVASGNVYEITVDCSYTAAEAANTMYQYFAVYLGFATEDDF